MGSPPPLAVRLRQQADHCRSAGSPLTAALLEGAAGELGAGGPVDRLLGPLEDDPPGTVPALRFAGALHRLVLERQAPGLAVHYPSVGGRPGEVWPAARAAVEEHLERLHELVRRPVQTNEVGRSSALLGGLLVVASGTGLPVRLLEVGASGGLNLQVDRYRHEVAEGVVLGDPTSPVVLDAPWAGTPPPAVPLRIVERRGCDPAPLDPTSAEDRLTLTSYVWADQLARFERLRGALQVAAASPEPVERLAGSAFFERELRDSRPGVATVVWQSVVRQYLDPAERERGEAVLAEAGRRATDEAPLACLTLEPERGVGGGDRFVVELTSWPGGSTRVLAQCGGHGPPITWR